MTLCNNTESIRQEDVMLINIYAPNSKAPKFMKNTLSELNGEIDSAVIAGFLNTPLLIMSRTTSHTINQETEDLDNTIY